MVDGIAVINDDVCTGCGMCVDVCPRNIIQMPPKDQTVVVMCRNEATGKRAVQQCKTACVACKRCEKACQFDAIHVVNNCAIIDPVKCTLCGECVKVCPTNCIEQLA